jgi:pantothenate kinase
MQHDGRVPAGTSVVTVRPEGGELETLLALLKRPDGRSRSRRIVGIAGSPGSGKSTLAAHLASMLGGHCEPAVVPLDGFHLADVSLRRLGLLDRKGAPETFDAWGYAALLERLRARPAVTVYAPEFDRRVEQPVAGAIAVAVDVDVVLTEGSYLLLDRPEWRACRPFLDDVWYVTGDEWLRRDRLVARHVRFGKKPAAAHDWVRRVDEPNARLVERSRPLADLVVDLTEWGHDRGLSGPPDLGVDDDRKGD